jgi:DNA-binding NtrC family response regulator
LYYRLNVFPIEIAPLARAQGRHRGAGVKHFVELSAEELNRPRPRLTQANLLQLQRYDWPGNIRELQNVIERAVITATSGRLGFDLPTDEKSGDPRWTHSVGGTLHQSGTLLGS